MRRLKLNKTFTLMGSVPVVRGGQGDPNVRAMHKRTFAFG